VLVQGADVVVAQRVEDVLELAPAGVLKMATK
jgi:hypothetical protein